jgi:hypothetical protein
MNNEKDFSNDPLFKDLRKFAAKQTGPETMPVELFEAFRSAGKTKVRSKWIGRTVIGLILTSVALPSLSYAHVLPTPVSNVVKRVVHLVSAPVRVVASVVVSEPAPTTDLTQATQTPAPVDAPATPAVVQTPVPVATKHEEEKKAVNPTSPKKNSSEGHEDSKSESMSEAKKSSSKSESDDEGGTAPKIPASGTSAPSVSGSGETKSESKSESKSGSSEKSDD